MTPSVQKQTAREMKEGARQSRRHAKQKVKPELAPLPTLDEDDPDVVLPKQVRRQVLVTNALLEQSPWKPEPKVLLLNRLLQLAEQIKVVAEELM